MVHKRNVKIWMLKKGIQIKDVAHGVGKSSSYVSHYLAGKKKAPVIREWFIGQGCPVKYLGGEKKEAA